MSKTRTAQLDDIASFPRSLFNKHVIYDDFALLPQIAAYAAGDNANFELEGTGAADGDCTHLIGGGIQLNADSGTGSADDECVLVRGANQVLEWTTDDEPTLTTKILTGSVITNYQLKVGLGSDSAGTAAADGTDGDNMSDTYDTEFLILFDTDDGDANWKVNHTLAGASETEIDTAIPVVLSTHYLLQIRVRTDRRVDYWINDTLVYVGAAQTTAKIMGPHIGVSGLDAVDKTLGVRWVALTKLHQD
jgi:hypothetical protein